jgi:thiol-disulfide isomerase/thioredoxin
MQWRLMMMLALLFLASSEAFALPKGIMQLDSKPAPALKLKNMDGELYDLQAHKGQWQFVHFWATWCGPCRREMPTIQALYGKIDAAKMNIVLVNTAESEDMVFSFLAAVAPDLVPLMDVDGQVTEVWQPRGLPATFLVGPEGNLHYLALGGRPWDKGDYVAFLKGLYSQ